MNAREISHARMTQGFTDRAISYPSREAIGEKTMPEVQA